VIAVVTLVGFVGEPGAITWRWIAVLRWAFGWGAVLVPLLLGSFGAWLVVDAVEEAGRSVPGRPVAAGVSFVAFLGLAHLVVAARGDVSGGRALAEAQMAGGWLGYGVSAAAAALLGPVAAGVVLGSAAVVALAAAAGVTLGELARETLRLARAAIATAQGAAAGVGGDDAAAVPLPAVAEAVRIPEEIEAPGQAADAAPGGAGEVGAGHGPPESEAGGGAGAARSRLPGKAPPTRWRLPDVDRVLEPPPAAIKGPDDAEAKARLIEDTFAEFGVEVRVVEINRGPTITQFGIEPGYVERAGRRSRVKVSRIVGLQNDLALALAASPIRIQAPVPGRPFVGIEVPNASSAVVSLRGVLESDAFRKVAARGMLPVALGRDTTGTAVAADLAAMPHLLIAGATGSGKSVALNAIVATLLVTHTPDTLKLLLVDPKRVEMAPFRGLPHLAAPVIVEVERVVGVLQWAVREMDRRYRKFASRGARHVAAFNRQAVALGEKPMPYLVLIVDELADLMMVAPEEVERLVTRLAQLARATGIHLIIATQRPSVDVVTGL
ncbi:MAG: DNA translocase FtsK 4TM domain-containing protein, partial [Anaerolineae bacterium]